MFQVPNGKSILVIDVKCMHGVQMNVLQW